MNGFKQVPYPGSPGSEVMHQNHGDKIRERLVDSVSIKQSSTIGYTKCPVSDAVTNTAALPQPKQFALGMLFFHFCIKHLYSSPFSILFVFSILFPPSVWSMQTSVWPGAWLHTVQFWGKWAQSSWWLWPCLVSPCLLWRSTLSSISSMWVNGWYPSPGPSGIGPHVFAILCIFANM